MFGQIIKSKIKKFTSWHKSEIWWLGEVEFSHWKNTIYFCRTSFETIVIQYWGCHCHFIYIDLNCLLCSMVALTPEQRPMIFPCDYGAQRGIRITKTNYDNLLIFLSFYGLQEGSVDTRATSYFKLKKCLCKIDRTSA